MTSDKQLSEKPGLNRRDFLRFSTGAAAALALSSLPNLSQAASTTPREATILSNTSESTRNMLTKISDNVYSYVDVKMMSPQNSFGANAGIIIGQDGILVVDTLVSAKEAQRFINDIRAISDKPIKYVVNTHYHLDHTFGNSEFVKLGAVIMSHVIDKENFRKSGERVLKNAGNYGLSVQDIEGTAITNTGLGFTDKLEVDLGDVTVEIIYAGSSHTDGSSLIYLPTQKIMFAGDILFTGYHPLIAGGNIPGWLNALDYVLNMDVTTIIPGHGPVSTKQDIEDMKQYLALFDEKAKELCTQSNDVKYIVAELKKVLPERPEGEGIISTNIKNKYLRKI